MERKEILKEEVQSLLSKIRDLIRSHTFNIKEKDGEHAKSWEQMVSKAIELHKLVKPKHHKYMIKNRGCSPDDPEFYNHIHPIEDLLAYMDDPHANDDPEDQTIGHEFTFRAYSRRWGHYDTYQIKRTETGWNVSHISIGGGCDKDGKPYLYENLNHDSINYPEELPGYMEWLWNRAQEQGLRHDEVQSAFDQLSEWVSICEKNSPSGIWEGYK